MRSLELYGRGIVGPYSIAGLLHLFPIDKNQVRDRSFSRVMQPLVPAIYGASPHAVSQLCHGPTQGFNYRTCSSLAKGKRKFHGWTTSAPI